MKSEEKKTSRKEKISLLMRFLKGAKHFFAISIFAAGITALADIIQPQIIRTAVDCIVDVDTSELPAIMQTAVHQIGGFSYLKNNLWILAVAVISICKKSAKRTVKR